MRAIITGATKGIGRAIAEAFAEEGFDLAVCSRTEADLKEMETAFAKMWPESQLLTHAADMRNKEAVLGFGAFVEQHWDNADVLVNNAGVFIPGQILEEEDGMMELMMETNLYSAYHLTRRLIPLIQAGQRPHLFNICSVASLIAYPNGGSYSISKFAMLGFSKVLREELKPEGVRVTSVMPGATWSASWAGVDLPAERLMPARDIAAAVLNAWQMSAATVVEEILLRPQLGDL
jgi:short-subunit dehydrogenase